MEFIGHYAPVVGGVVGSAIAVYVAHLLMGDGPDFR
jgi:hypothetical protein